MGRKEAQTELPPVPAPEYTQRDVDQIRSRMMNLRRSYVFRRGGALTKALNGNTRGEMATSRKKDKRDDNRQQILARTASWDIALAASNGHSAFPENRGIVTSKRGEGILYVTETPSVGGIARPGIFQDRSNGTGRRTSR